MNELKSSLSIPIDKLRMWQSKSWIKYNKDPLKMVLKIHLDQILIIADNKVLESLSCYGKIKGYRKDDNLILIIGTNSNEIRKIKFQIKAQVEQCLQQLGSRFAIVNTSNTAATKFTNIEDVLRRALEKNDHMQTLPLPPNYGSFIKLCLLDPLFPQLVLQTQEVLDKELIRKEE